MSFPCQFRTRGNVVVDKDLTQSRVLFLHMVKMLGLGIEFRVYSFNPLFTVEFKARCPVVSIQSRFDANLRRFDTSKIEKSSFEVF